MNSCGLDTAGKAGGVQFFIYITIKIMALLGFLILMISYIQGCFPLERSKKILGRFHGIGSSISAYSLRGFLAVFFVPCFTLVLITPLAIAAGKENLLWLVF